MMSVFKKLLNKSVNGRLRDGLATSPDRILSLCLSIAAALLRYLTGNTMLLRGELDDYGEVRGRFLARSSRLNLHVLFPASTNVPNEPGEAA